MTETPIAEAVADAHNAEWWKWSVYSKEGSPDGAHWNVMRGQEEIETGLQCYVAQERCAYLRRVSSARAAIRALAAQFQDPVVVNALLWAAGEGEMKA